MITIFILLLGFICLIIVGLWYDRIIPPITKAISRIIPSSPPEETAYSIDESPTEVKEYPKLEDIKDPTPMRMSRHHLIYLTTGVFVHLNNPLNKSLQFQKQQTFPASFS